jgi:lipopolysaccharide export system protein LptA
VSDKMVYSVVDNVAVLMGNVKITRGDNQLNGEAAEMNMTTKVNRVIAGPAAGRVSGLLIPGQNGPQVGKPAAKP